MYEESDVICAPYLSSIHSRQVCMRKILINAVDPEECRIAIVKDSKLEEFRIETAAKEITQGNIYKGVVSRVEPSLQAVFVDYGAERHGFLQKNEIHSDYYLDNHSGDNSIKNIIKRGQELLVQVTKDPVLKKGAMLTTFISLPGRYSVLMPGSKNRGISRKIENEKERVRIKDIISKLEIPEDFGMIVRTMGENCTKTSLAKDIKYLMRLWRTINKKGMKEQAPFLLHKERSLAVRSMRDSLTDEVTEILIDDQDVYKEVKDFISLMSPKQTKIVKLFKGEKPIFTKYQLENQITSIFENRVELKSGGSIVIEQTEALVAIDVNSGKAVHKKSFEETALLTNLDACEEVSRQLRLRDMGGLIVIDFIDMKDAKHRLEVEKALKGFVKEDKARVKVGRITKFGLLEMSRQRLRPSIASVSFDTCTRCKGKGIIPSKESLGISVLRKLRLETLKDDVTAVKCFVPKDVANYLLNNKRKELLTVESRRNLKITIEGDSGMVPGDVNIISEK